MSFPSNKNFSRAPQKSAPKQVAGERLLTVKEAAQSLGMCADSVRRHLRSGKLQGVRVGGGWRVPESKLALQLGLLSVAALPALDVTRPDSKPKTTVAAQPSQTANSELLDTLFQTESVQVRVRQLVEVAAIAAEIPLSARANLARELELALGLSDETA